MGRWIGGLAWISVGGCLPWLPDVADPCASWQAPGWYRIEVPRSDSHDRRPHVYVPQAEGPRDVVVLLHGAGMSGSKMDDVANFVKGADQHGFVLVTPDGLGWPLRDWNAGPAFEDGRDDVAFLEALVGQLAPRVCGDAVLATGFSNGAMMAHRWGCEGRQIDAIAPVSGPMMVDACDGDPLPVRHYHGTDDPVVPAEGGEGTSLRDVVFRSADQSMATWRERNQCSDEAPEVTVTGDTSCSRWDCAVPTELCLIEGWGHRWPGGIHATQTDANATQAIWDWFRVDVLGRP